MHENDRRYRDGEVIFREGDASHCAYVLISGSVDLSKKTERGELTLATMGPGEMFGEMGVFDLSARSASARAKGEVLLRTIPPDDFIDSLTNRPEAALAVVGKLVKRLRASDERLAKAFGSGVISGGAVSAPMPGVSPSPSPKPGFLRRLLRLREKEPQPKKLEVRLARLEGDKDGSQGKRILAALSKRKEINVKILPETVIAANTPEALPGKLNEIATASRSWLQKAEADVLIWGSIPAPGPTIQLRFVPAEAEDEDRPGAFALLTSLNLPVNFSEELADVIYAVTLAASGAASPLTREKPEPVLVAALPAAIKAVLPMIQEMPAEMTPLERSGITLSLANAAAGAAAGGISDLYQVAAHGYKKSLHLMKRDAAPYDWALAQRNLGIILQVLGERNDDHASYAEAAACYSAALEVFTKTNFPILWATTQNRLGECYYRQDLDTGDTELIKSALIAFQSAAVVVTRTDRPQLWAKIMNNFAQAALLLGELLPSREALERAVIAAKGALEVRLGDANPLPWATTQNTLGLALFLLGKQTRDRILLSQAVAALRQAQDVYGNQGATRMVAVVEKNLARAEDLLEEISPSRVPRMRLEPDDE